MTDKAPELTHRFIACDGVALAVRLEPLTASGAPLNSLELMLHALADEVEAFRRADGWRDISSLPKDKPIDIWLKSGVRCIDAWWSESWEAWLSDEYIFTKDKIAFWRYPPSPPEEG